MARRSSDASAVVCPSCDYAERGSAGKPCPVCETPMIVDAESAGAHKDYGELGVDDEIAKVGIYDDEFVEAKDGNWVSLEEEARRELDDEGDDYF